jgi:hypothetical protein
MIQDNCYHRYLNIPFDPNIDLFNRIEYDQSRYTHVEIKKEEINPKLLSWFSQYNIEITWYEAFYTPPNGGKLPIHTDGDEDIDYIKINWTYGAPGSTLCWWEPRSKEYINTVETVFGTRYYTADEQNCNKLYEVEINKPSLVNAGKFHSTYNPTQEGRWTFTMPLLDSSSKNRLTWNDAIQRFKGLIIE